MNQTWPVILLSIISFIVITMQWEVIPEDAPGSTMYGFPLPYSCDAWYTSLARQFFILELIVDLGFYFLIWLLVQKVFDKFHIRFLQLRPTMIILTLTAGLLLSVSLFLVFAFEHKFKLYREFEFEIKEVKVSIL